MKANVYVTLKKGVHDPQGEAVRHTLAAMGHREIKSVRIGKFIELEVAEDDSTKAEEKVKEVCENLLANTVIESFRFEME